MHTVQVFDPALCCSSGVCGAQVDQRLVSFAADVDWARKQGAQVERVNLAQQPTAFAANDAVKGVLQRAGDTALPLVLVDGAIALASRYPDRAELARLAGIAAPADKPATAGGCCAGGACC